MIFISHHNKDAKAVLPVVKRLSNFFDREDIKIDSWFSEPTERFQTELDNNTEEMRYFFLFVTENSLHTDMIKFEWLSTIRKKNNIMLIPIRVEKIAMPKEFSAFRYLDLYTEDLERVTTQMAEIIGKDNTKEGFDNLQGYVVTKDKETFSFYVVAKEFFEANSTFLIVTDYEQDELDVNIPGTKQLILDFYPDMEVVEYGPVNEKMKVNGFLIGMPGGLTKGNPLEITVRKLKGDGKFIDLHHVQTKTDLPKIDLKFVDDVAEMKADL